MSKRMSTGSKVLIGGAVVAAVGGIGYFIWKKMKENEEEQEPSFQAQSSTLAGMGAAASSGDATGISYKRKRTTYSEGGCPAGYTLTGFDSLGKACCMSLVLREEFVTRPIGKKCSSPFAFDGGSNPSLGVRYCYHTPQYLMNHGCYPGTTVPM